MIEDVFLQYGAIGACLVLMSTFFYKYYVDSKKFQDKFFILVDNNTIAMTKVYEIIQGCSKRKI